MLSINFVIPETTLRVLRRTLTIAPYNALDCQALDIPKLLKKIILNIERAAIGNYSLVNIYPAEPPSLQSPFNSIKTLKELIAILNTCLRKQRFMLQKTYGSTFYCSIINSLRTAITILNTAPIFPERSSPEPIQSAPPPPPYLVFNPIFISLTLCYSREQLLLSPYISSTQTPFSLKDQLTSHARKLKEAALQRYSLLNHFPEKNSSSSPDHPKGITDLQTLVIKLEKWIKHNSLPLLNQCGLSALRDIYKDLSEAANCLSLTSFQTLLQIENPPQTKHEPLLAYKASSTPVNSTPSLLLPPKKQKLKPTISDSSLPILSHIDKNLSIKKRLWKRSHETSIEAYSSPTKKHKSESPTPILGFFDLFTENLATDSSPLGSPLNLEELIETLRPETPIIPKAYEVEELTLAGNNIFTLTSITTEDLESWINHAHSLVGQCLNYPENLLVNSLADVSALEHESQTNLRKFTLQQLLKFMNRNLPFLSKIQDQQSHQEITALHGHLTKELENALSEIEKALIPPATTLILPSPIQNVKLPNDNNKFIKVTVCKSHFLISSRYSIKSGFDFKKFLVQVEKASKLSKYSSLQIISGIEKESSNNLLTSLMVLYHVTKQNYLNFKYLHPFSKIDREALASLNTLNQKYCFLMKEEHDDNHHHNNLKEQAISIIQPPTSVASTPSLSYFTVFCNPKFTDIFWIRKMNIPSPIDNNTTVLNNWIISLKKHAQRMHNLHSYIEKHPVFLKCNDKSWALTHLSALPIPKAQLENILGKIAQSNLTLCTSYFLEISPEGKEIKHPGYNETIELLSPLTSIFKTTPPERPASDIAPINYLTATDNLFTPTHAPFITLRVRNSYFILSVSQILHMQKSNFSKIVLHQIKQIKSNIKKIINESSFPIVKTSTIPITNLTTLIPMMYWGLGCNISLVKSMFPKSFIENKNVTAVDLKLKEVLLDSEEIQAMLLESWKKISPLTPISPYESLNHPFKENFTIIYKEINQYTETKTKNIENYIIK
ncbi:hypothetical protein CLAVI_000886 [Candidatus Clavichlamydia salmonicola]|uniref:hypothetical protein n=1 Tax=Candidatus Clavichlamydia salmonicola TaxID=469812 RepID=UPI001890D2BC|nr:hypothetical protein [Candidatus Clavichlamydia salmonicola]MBF5051245.1 hypothetical protein [Candidatus Clavichlamydia salmonicola]